MCLCIVGGGCGRRDGGARPANLIGRSVILHGPGPAAGSLAPASRWRPAQVHRPGPAAGSLAPASRRRQWKHCQLGSAGADGPATGAGTCRDDVHRPRRPYLLLVRARPPLVSAPLKLVSGVDCSDRVWRQGILHRPRPVARYFGTTRTGRRKQPVNRSRQPQQRADRARPPGQIFANRPHHKVLVVRLGCLQLSATHPGLLIARGSDCYRTNGRFCPRTH